MGRFYGLLTLFSIAGVALGAVKNTTKPANKTRVTEGIWTGGKVYYEIDHGKITPRILRQLKRAMNLLEANTCLKFIDVNVTSSPDYVFISRWSGCWAQIGKIGGKQNMSIGKYCDYDMYARYELGQVIGLQSVHKRRDRDKYVNILWEHVRSTPHNFSKAFQMMSKTQFQALGTPYDVESVMHYFWSAYQAKRFGKPTMTPKSIAYTYKMGFATQYSFLDYKNINLLYNCTGGKCSSINCGKDGGYPDKNCKCVCPPGFSGAHCEKGKAPNPFDCGGEITINGTSDIFNISTPTYPHRSGFEYCAWDIKSPNGTRISVTFVDFLFTMRRSLYFLGKLYTYQCLYEWVDYRGSDMRYGERYCGKDLKGKTKTSEKNQMRIIIKPRANQTKLYYPKQRLPECGGLFATIKVVQ